MKKTAALLFAVMVFSVTLLTVSPALAKPNEIIITVKDPATNKPRSTFLIAVADSYPTEPVLTGYTDAHGKVTFTPAASWTTTTVLEVWIYDPILSATVDTSVRFSLSKTNSARVTVYY